MSETTTTPNLTSYPCPEADCLVFPFDNAADLAEHIATGDHVALDSWKRIPTDGIGAGLCSVDAPERTGNGTPGSGRSQQGPAVMYGKVGGEWCVKVRRGAGTIGDVVEVSLKSGATKTETLGAIMQEDGQWTWHAKATPAGATADVKVNRFAGRCETCGHNVPAGEGSLSKSAAGRWETRHLNACPVVELDVSPRIAEHAPAAEFEVEAGRVYASADGEFIQAHEGRRGQLYGKVWNGRKFTYEAGALARICRNITAEEAAAFGHETHRCVFCVRTLTDDRSTEVGYGPVCAARYGLPWGASSTTTAAEVDENQGVLL
jgi:hypothetical protein